MNLRLQIRGLTFLDWGPFNFSVADRECVGISGASGTGKSLLLRAIADLDPHDGEVTLDGQASTSVAAPEWRRSVGLLTAESRWWHDGVGDHFFGHDAGGLLADLGFGGANVLDWEVSRLSVGERQRLALARLLCRGPKALLLDEPTANLDAQSTTAVENIITRYALPVIWVSHDRDQLRRVASRRFRMEDRQLKEDT